MVILRVEDEKEAVRNLQNLTHIQPIPTISFLFYTALTKTLATRVRRNLLSNLFVKSFLALIQLLFSLGFIHLIICQYWRSCYEVFKASFLQLFFFLSKLLLPSFLFIYSSHSLQKLLLSLHLYLLLLVQLPLNLCLLRGRGNKGEVVYPRGIIVLWRRWRIFLDPVKLLVEGLRILLIDLIENMIIGTVLKYGIFYRALLDQAFHFLHLFLFTHQGKGAFVS